MTEYLRMSGMYWGLTVMDLMDSLDQMDRQEVLEFVKQCQHECGGVGASVGHDPHLLYTLSAVQVCWMVLSIILSLRLQARQKICLNSLLPTKYICHYDLSSILLGTNIKQ